MKWLNTGVYLAALLATSAVSQAAADPAVDGCLRQLKTVGGPDAQNGIDILTTDWSQAGTMVTMRDAGGTLWSCIGYEDGTVGDLKVVEAADDGAGAMDGSMASEGALEGTTTTQKVKFAKGTSGAEYEMTLTPGSSTRYILGARKGQFLTVHVASDGAGTAYQIFNPDQTFLLDMMTYEKDYRGQLWQSGDHVVEVINRSDAPRFVRIDIDIE